MESEKRINSPKKPPEEEPDGECSGIQLRLEMSLNDTYLLNISHDSYSHVRLFLTDLQRGMDGG